MIVFYINDAKKQHTRLIRSMYRSYIGDRRLLSTEHFEKNLFLNENAKMIVFAGMIRGEGLIYKWCMENKKDFLYMDHAYLNRGYNSSNPKDEWMRVTQNGFVWNKNVPETGERWKKHFDKKHPLHNWRRNLGKNILVLPPSKATQYLFPDSVHWTNYVVDRLKKIHKAPIVIREKPDQVQIDPLTNSVTGREVHHHTRSIDSEIADAKVIVAYNSAVPITGIIQGVPCITSPQSAAYPMSTPEELWESLPEPNRLPWLWQLVNHQFTAEEFKNGIFWERIRKYNDISGFR